LDQANGSIAEIMGLPSPFGNAGFPKQDFCYCAIAVAFDVTVKRPYCECKPLASLGRHRGMRPSERPFLECRPQPMRRVGLQIEIVVQSEFKDNERPLGWEFL
jgi:hypothetical protein